VRLCGRVSLRHDGGMAKQSEAAAHAAEMERVVARWKSSGLTQAEFCRREGIRPHTLSYWNTRNQRPPKVPGTFVEFSSNPPPQLAPSAVSYEVSLPGDVIIRLRGDVTPDTVRNLIRAVVSP